MDLVIRRADGWKEVSVPRERVQELWEAAAVGDLDGAISAIFWDDEDDEGLIDRVTDVRVIAVPDGLVGEYVRVWVKVG